MSYHMKRIQSILLFIIGIFVIVSCGKEDTEPQLYLKGGLAVSSPSASKTYLLLETNAAAVAETFTWTPADFGFKAAITYTLQIAQAGKNFATPVNVVSSGNLTYTIKVSDLNTLMLGQSFKGGTQYAMEGRVKATVSDYATPQYSTTFTFNIIPYEMKLPPIYLVGDATLGAWDNAKGQVMSYWSTGIYGVVTPLQANKNIKALKTSGAWAPQWGQASGTWDTGKLAYRPTENVTDPPSIPSPPTAGDYLVVFNIDALTYTQTLMPDKVYLVGDGCSAGWTPTSGLAFTKSAPGLYSLTTALTASKNLKIMYSNSGAWAPQWGTVSGAIAALGKLSFRPTEAVADPASIPTPATAGNYKIELNFNENTYKITAQ
jgi:starch-binding outer membrane protein SusE/F